MRGTPPVRTVGGGGRWEASPEAAPRAAGTERPPAPRAHAHSAEARRWDSDPPGLAAFTVGGPPEFTRDVGAATACQRRGWGEFRTELCPLDLDVHALTPNT